MARAVGRALVSPPALDGERGPAFEGLYSLNWPLMAISDDLDRAEPPDREP